MTGGGEQVAGSFEGGWLPVVLAVLGQIRELAALVQGAPGWQLSDVEARLAVKEAAVAARQLESAYLGLVYDLDQRPGVVKGARAGFQARTFIRHSLNQTTARAEDDVAAAYALRPDANPAKGGLPRLGAAFAAGEVSREHVNAAVRAAARIPKPLLSAPAAADETPAGGAPTGTASDPADDTASDPAGNTAADSAGDTVVDAAASEATAGAGEAGADPSADLAAGSGDADRATAAGVDPATETSSAASDPAAASGGWGLFRCGGDVVDEEFTRHARD